MWTLAETELPSRFFMGTANFPTLELLKQALAESQSSVITVSLKRQAESLNSDHLFWKTIKDSNCCLLPNTAGCHQAAEAVTLAEIARELFQTNWIKLEVIGDDYNLQPDPFELVTAAAELTKRGFVVFPYCTDDLVLCQRLIDCGCSILMPWAAPIGSGKGILNPYALETLRTRLPKVTLIVDAGIGKPSQAAWVMEMGFDGVLLNTAVSSALHPVKMAGAFRDAIVAGRAAFEAGLMLERSMAHPSTSLIDTPFWQQSDSL